MDKVYVIRHKVIAEGKSIRSVARAMSVSRNIATRNLGLSVSVRKERISRLRQLME